MAQIKAHEFEALIGRGLPPQPIFLVYGPDRGLVAERARALAEASGVALDDDFSVVRLDVSALAAEPGRLIDEARSIGLFGGRRLIWVRDAGNERALLEQLDVLLKDAPKDTTIIIEAGELRKGASLRKAVEDSRTGLAVPCYADEGRAIHGLIDEEMAAAGLRVTAGARQLLTELLGGDRLASRGELKKLALYCRGKDVVDEDDVTVTIGDASALSVDDAVDAVLEGRLAALDLALQRIVASKSPAFLALQACLRQFQLLDTLRAAVDGGKPLQSVLASEGRRIHFKRKPAIESALRTWKGSDIAAALTHLQAAILETRRNAALEAEIARQALLALAVRSGRAVNRR